jgi:hypothetical protein
MLQGYPRTKRVMLQLHPHPHQAGLIFPSWWNVRQKVVFATLSLYSVGETQLDCDVLCPHAPFSNVTLFRPSNAGHLITHRPRPHYGYFGNFLRRKAFALASTIFYACQAQTSHVSCLDNIRNISSSRQSFPLKGLSHETDFEKNLNKFTTTCWPN